MKGSRCGECGNIGGLRKLGTRMEAKYWEVVYVPYCGGVVEAEQGDR